MIDKLLTCAAGTGAGVPVNEGSKSPTESVAAWTLTMKNGRCRQPQGLRPKGIGNSQRSSLRKDEGGTGQARRSLASIGKAVLHACDNNDRCYKNNDGTVTLAAGAKHIYSTQSAGHAIPCGSTPWACHGIEVSLIHQTNPVLTPRGVRTPRD